MNDTDQQPMDAVDAELLGGLRRIHEHADPVPAGLIEDVLFAIDVQALHAEVAEIQQRSLEGAGVRGGDYSTAETLTFSGGDFTTMVTISQIDRESVRLDGWVIGGPARIELRGTAGGSMSEPDEDGRFVFDAVPRGLVRFVLHPKDPTVTTVITPAFEI